MTEKFQGTENYIATEDLRIAVNAALTLERPLLIKGEPGAGKTVLAEEVSKALDMELITWHIKSTTKAQQGLYEYCLLYTSPSPRDGLLSRMPSSA